jgi:hypothetical protein
MISMEDRKNEEYQYLSMVRLQRLIAETDALNSHFEGGIVGIPPVLRENAERAEDSAGSHSIPRVLHESPRLRGDYAS